MKHELRIGEPIGYGGSAVVCEAWRRLPDGTEQPVAVKRLLPAHRDDPVFVARFKREAALCMTLTHNHPNLVSVYDYQRMRDGEILMIMERVDGVSIDHFPGLGAPCVRYVLQEVARALAFVHSHGLLHRDISPRNIVAARDGRIKVLDFGLAKSLGSPRSDVGFKGTAPYASGEALYGLKLDASADLYSLAAVGYELLAGEPPYGSAEAVVIKHRMVIREITPLPETVPRDLATLIEAALHPWETRTIREASQFLDALGEPVAQPQEIARAVLELGDSGKDSTGTEPAARHMPRALMSARDGRRVDGARRRWGVVAMLGIVAVCLLLYVGFRPERTAGTLKGPVSAGDESRDVPVAPEPVNPPEPVIIEVVDHEREVPSEAMKAAEETNTTGPGKPARIPGKQAARRAARVRATRPSAEKSRQPAQQAADRAAGTIIAPARVELPPITTPPVQDEEPRWIKTKDDGAQEFVERKDRVETRPEDVPSDTMWSATKAED